jgi:Protein of unknown function (DUF3485)
LINRFIIPLAFLILIVVGFMRVDPANKELVRIYHEQVAELINLIPIEFGDWVGQEVPLPESATNLLDPNALVARLYAHEEKGITATLMIVQCKDTRDMAGHYPPQCYPSNGWSESIAGVNGIVDFEDYELFAYSFRRVVGREERAITVYNIFALPTGELTHSMKQVRRLASDYDMRDFGAAQVQVVIDGGVDIADHDWIVRELYRVAQPAISAVIESDQVSFEMRGQR